MAGDEKWMNEKMNEANEKDAIKILNVKLNQFWERNPELWFVQDEVRFGVHNITADKTKYNLAVTALPAEACESVYDVLTNPPTTNKYIALKTALLQERRLEKLLERKYLGDRKPSELLLEMKRFAGDGVPDLMFKRLWLR